MAIKLTPFQRRCYELVRTIPEVAPRRRAPRLPRAAQQPQLPQPAPAHPWLPRAAHPLPSLSNTAPGRNCRPLQGKCATYGGVAAALGSCARAVGQAMRKNPLAPDTGCPDPVPVGAWPPRT